MASPNAPLFEQGVSDSPAKEVERLKATCEQLRLDKETLDRKLKESEALAAHREQSLRAVMDEFQQFAYAASHDLQEPLRGITSYVQLLKRSFEPQHHPSSDAETLEFLGYIETNSTRMTVLLRDLLTYSRVPQHPRRTIVSLKSVFDGVRLRLYKDLADSGATLTNGDLPEVLGDETQLSQLFSQLVSNSVKFRSTAAPVIEISAIEDENETVISVRDNGQGIAPQFHAQVFSLFKRLHGHEVPGTGIGLSICQKIVRSLDGRIWLESDGKSGSTFFVALPR